MGFVENFLKFFFKEKLKFQYFYIIFKKKKTLYNLGVFTQISCFPSPLTNKKTFGEILDKYYEEFDKIKYKKDFSLKSQVFFL